jgi:hypothetical protein
MNYAEESLRLHGEWQGKIEVISRVPVKSKDDLSLAYTPGVAQPCLEIQKDYNKSFTLTRRSNLVAVITDGTAVLGLGDIGPEAGMPVMEGKCALFKSFGDVDAFPICIRSKDVDEIVRTIYLISGSFGGINLEDISAPRCFEVERRLKEIRLSKEPDLCATRWLRCWQSIVPTMLEMSLCARNSLRQFSRWRRRLYACKRSTKRLLLQSRRWLCKRRWLPIIMLRKSSLIIL